MLNKTIMKYMNGELYFEGKKYISSSRAAKLSGYVNDYIGQLCRDGKVESRMVGRSWYVSVDSLLEHKKANALSKAKRKKDLSQKSKEQYARVSKRDLETNYVTPDKVDMDKVGRNVLGKPKEYWTR